MLTPSSLSSTTPADLAEADALDTAAHSLEALAVTALDLARSSRTLAAALRTRGSGGCDVTRMDFVVATALFIAAWRASQQSIAQARDAVKEGLYDD